MASIRGIQVDYPDVEEINATAAKDPNLRSRLRDGFNDANRFHPKKMAAAKVAGKTALAAGATALIDAATPEDSALGAGAKTAVQAAAVHPLLAAPAGALSAMQTAANNQAKANGYGSGIEYGLAREQQQMQADTLRKSQNLQRVLPRANIPASMQEGANRASGLDANGQLPENALRASLRASDPYYRQPAAEPPQKAQAAPAPQPTPAPAPAPQPTPAPAPAPQPKDFGAPAGTTVTTPIADQPSIRKIVGPDGKVTYSNADNYKDATNLANGNVSTVGIDKAAIERGIAADRDLHNARIEALDGRAPVEGGRVASLRGGADGEIPWWAGQFEFGRAAMQQRQADADRASRETIADRQERGAALRDELRFNRDVQLKGMDVQADQAKTLRQAQLDELTALRNGQADRRSNEAAYDTRSKAARDRISQMFPTFDDKGKATPNDALATQVEAAFANMPDDAPAELKGKNFADLSPALQRRVAAAQALSSKLASDRSKWGVQAEAIPTVWELLLNPGLVSQQGDGAYKIGANGKVEGGMMPWFDMSAADVNKEYGPLVRALQGQ